MLPFLLFAGAISINLQDLLEDKLTILLLATFGVFFSTVSSASDSTYDFNNWLDKYKKYALNIQIYDKRGMIRDYKTSFSQNFSSSENRYRCFIS